MFSFTSGWRKPKPLMDSISCPLSPAEVKYMEKNDIEPNSQPSAQRPRAEQLASCRPILASMNTYDAENRSKLTTPASPQHLQKRSARHDRPVGRRAVPDSHQHHLNRERSSSTLRSYYDRRKSPLAVSQQTSASSARDFALRKGCPPVVPSLHPGMTSPGQLEHASCTNKAAPKKRPGRLDLSMLFPKPSPRSGPLLSPRRYTDCPPPMSVTSKMPFTEPQPQTLLHDKRASDIQEQVSAYPTQGSRNAGPPLAKTIRQKHRVGVRNWFDGVEDDISEDDADLEPEMALDFVETAFPTPSSKFTQEASLQLGIELSEEVGFHHRHNYPLSVAGKRSISPKTIMSNDNRLRHPPDRRETMAQIAAKEICGSVSWVQTSASVAHAVDLREESVLWSSSSDDEGENILMEDQHGIPEHGGPLLRDSLGIDSIDSDVELGTAQAVNTSFLRTFEPRAKSRSLGSGSSVKGRPRIQKLQAVEIPDRRSSKRGASGIEHQKVVPSSDDGITKNGSANPVDHDSLLLKRLATAAPAVAQRQSPLVMALTPQEASLLAAMRSKRDSMRQTLLTEAHRLVAEEYSSSGSTPLFNSPFGRNEGSRSTDKRPAASDVEFDEARKNSSANIASTESTLPSGRGSLIFSESLPSPTTSRDSPTTPMMDFRQELSVLHDLGNQHDPRLHTVKANQYGHARCRTGRGSIIVLDNFQSPQNESIGSDEYPWVFRGFSGRPSSTMIH